MRENRSFIFFRETALADATGRSAPRRSAHAGRSLAVDRTLHTFHTPSSSKRRSSRSRATRAERSAG